MTLNAKAELLDHFEEYHFEEEVWVRRHSQHAVRVSRRRSRASSGGQKAKARELSQEEVFRLQIARRIAMMSTYPGRRGIVKEHGDILLAVISVPKIDDDGERSYCVGWDEKIKIFQFIQYNEYTLGFNLYVKVDTAKNRIWMGYTYSCSNTGPFPELVEARRAVRAQLGIKPE